MPYKYYVLAFGRRVDGNLTVFCPMEAPSRGAAMIAAQIDAYRHGGAVAVSYEDGSPPDEFEFVSSYGEVDLSLLSEGRVHDSGA